MKLLRFERVQFQLLAGAVLFLTLVFTNQKVVQADGPEAATLIQFLPNDANALAIVRVKDILQTPRAVREEWAKEADERFLSGAGGIPSWVNTLVVGFLVRPASSSEVWAAGVVSVPEAVSIEAVAAREQATIEKLGAINAIRSGRGSYVLGISKGIFGVWRPAIRQEATRWARAIESKVTAPLSEYLQEAARRNGHVVMAIDLENTLDPTMTMLHLREMKGITSDAQRDSVFELLMSLSGVTLNVHLNETSAADLRIDFKKDVGPNATVVRNFFLDVLHDHGAEIEEFAKASTKGEGASVVLTTTLSDDSMRRLISLISSGPAMENVTPSPEPSVASGTTPSASRPAVSPAEASQTYFRQIDNFVNDLARANRRATDYSRTAMWHENFAQKIDELPITGVDPELVDYGADISSKLRALARSLRGQQLAVNVQQGTLTYDVNFDPGWAAVSVWGGVGYGAPTYRVNSNLQQVRERQAAAVTAGAQQRDEIWAMMQESRAKVLRSMQQKYGPDFGRSR
jgi:hypothetical protein